MKAPAFQFYPADFIMGTNEMTSEEVGGYIRLLCHQWTNGGVPENRKKIETISRIFGESLDTVLEKFELCEGGKYKNSRLEAVRLEQEIYRAKQAENGKKGGNPAFKKGESNPYYKPQGNPKDKQADNPKDNPPIISEDNPKINPSPSSSNNKDNNTIPAGSKEPSKHDAFLKVFNDLTKRSFKTLDSKTKTQFDKLQKAGYRYNDFVTAITNGFKDSASWLKPQLFTPEYITREAMFSKYLNWGDVIKKSAYELEPKAYSPATKAEVDALFGDVNPNFKPKAA